MYTTRMKFSRQQLLLFVVSIIAISGIVFVLLHTFHEKQTVEISPLPSLLRTATPTKKPNPGITPTPLNTIKLPIVMYHYVEYVQNPGDTLRMKLDTTPFVLNFELKALKDNSYQTYFARDIPTIFAGGNVSNQKRIILTFDDGYEDFYENVFPLLKKYQFKATIYIIVNFIGRNGFMTQNQIQDLINSGLIEVAAHTLTHPSLSSIPIAKARTEIFQSKQKLEELFHIPVTTFAYPGGAYNKAVIELVKEASYSAALTTHPGVNLLSDHLLELPRIRPGYLTISLIKSYFEKLFVK